jgi:TRAP transporter TAXI family solute receptor
VEQTGKARRGFLKSAVALTLSAAADCSLSAPPSRDVYRWGSSSLGSSGYVIMEAFSQTVNRYTPYRSSSQATAGTAENMYLIGRGKLEFAHSTSVDWAPALAGQGPYKQPVGANQLLAYAVWQQAPIVQADSAIRSFRQLAGRRFSPSQPGSGTAAMYNVLMNAAGLNDRIRWRYGSWSEVYTAFRAHQIDSVVGVLTNGKPSSGIQQLEATTRVRVLEVPARVLERGRAANPGIFEDRLGPLEWGLLSAPVRIPMMTGIVAASTDITPEVGYEVTKAILDRASDVRQFGSHLSGLKPELAARHLIATAPVNAGAAQYFRENGLWRSDLTIAKH